MNFNNQFNKPVNINGKKKYFYAPEKSCKGFTELMKLVLMARPATNKKNKASSDSKKEEKKEKEDKINDPILEDIKKELKKDSFTIDKKNSHGWTALMIAVRNSNTKSSEDIVKLLIEEKADVNIKNNEGLTPLMIAAMNSGDHSTENTVRLLLSANAFANAKDNLGMNALMRICGDNFASTSDTIGILINAGININEVNEMDSKTAIMLAYQSNNSTLTKETIIKHLIDAGADYTSFLADIDMIKFVLKANQMIIEERREQSRAKQLCIDYTGQWSALITKAL